MTPAPAAPGFAGASKLDFVRCVTLLLVAAVPTILNALQPLAIDDAVYYLNARHILTYPLDPYGGSLRFWGMEGARMVVLSPPVVPYWWALSMAIVGDSVPLAKLLLYPFALLLTFAIDSLARRFAAGAENLVVALVVVSPWILPSFLFMLDVPALALGLAAVALFMRGCDRASVATVVAAGLLAGVAMQTKYTMATVPAVMLLYGLFARHIVMALIAGVAAAAVFIGTEAMLWAKYGESHFLSAAQRVSGQGLSTVRLRQNFYGLFGNTGPIVVALIPLAFVALRAPPRRVFAVLAGCAAAMLAILAGGDAWVGYLTPGGADRFPTPLHLSVLLGFAVLVMAAKVVRSHLAQRTDPVMWFLLAWLALEIAAYFAMSPFPAVRRNFGPFVVLTLILCRAVAPALSNERPRLSAAVVAFNVAIALGVWLIGYVDATNSRATALAGAARAKAEAGPNRAWIWGHLAVDHYAAQAGLERIVLSQTELGRGDVLMVAPADLATLFKWDLSRLEPIESLTPGTNLGVTLTPDYFFGQRPIVGKPDTRLRTMLYRVREPTAIRPQR